MSRKGPEAEPIRRRFLVAALPLGLVAAFILSLLPNIPNLAKTTAQGLGLYDHLAGGIFGVHAWTWVHVFGWMALAGTLTLILVKPAWAAIAAAGLFATSIGIEVLQSSLTSARGYSFEDVVANGSGITAGTSLALVISWAWSRLALPALLPAGVD